MTFNGTTAAAIFNTTNDIVSISIDIPSNNLTTKTVVYPNLYDRWSLPH